MKSNKKKAIELQPLVACLPGYENKNFKINLKLTPKFYHKSGAELRLEQSQQMKLLTY
jgi:hypothetical protein